MHQHKAAAAEIARFWQGHGQSKRNSDRCIDRIAAAAQNIDTDLGCPAILARNHTVRSYNGHNLCSMERLDISGSARLREQNSDAEEERRRAFLKLDVKHGMASTAL
jgi:hypothetical protein